MSSVSETALPFLRSLLPGITLSNVLVGAAVGLLATAFVIHYASPTRLTGVLVMTLSQAEDLYQEANEAGLLTSAELLHGVRIGATLSRLQREVSEIREATLRRSLSKWGTLGEFFRGRTLTLLQCISEVQRFKTHIEILKETQLRDINHIGVGTPTWNLYLRRRRIHSASSGYNH
ncbi:hypothetical protein B0H10DRAFT_1131394 [Mycena sp. CBHHK59/15]|nr:hypothetical protein B0H10DRAFT_1131394 [Mycena sp. CBHHK59/15]